MPLATATFVTLRDEMRAQGTALYSLIRNIGSSVGISVVQLLLIRGTTVAPAALVQSVTYRNPAWNVPIIASTYDTNRPSGAAALDQLITRQASMIAYITIIVSCYTRRCS